MNEDEIYNLEKNKLVILQKWSPNYHGETGNIDIDKYYKTKKLVLTTFNDEYDISSSDNIIEFIDYWLDSINHLSPPGGVWNILNNANFNTNPYIAIADTYIYKDYCFAIDKTFLIIKIQRKWRTYYNRLKKKILIAKQTRSIIYRETFGKFPVLLH